MNRNPLIPFALIGAFGLGLMFLLSFVGLGNMDEVAEDGGEAPQEDTASATPEEIYQQTCISCHGADFGGGVGPKLIGVGDKYSSEEIQDIIKNGKGIMQGGMVPNEKLEEMATWLMELQ
ncbi:cytochrome c [Cytobacillus sp. S13-E01]|uniref:cytochrome c550 n=1 Tax=Cytobacillus sp. S13-E01 TaxID=3031326 RepID=UPI0023D8485E|nr:cytochrome c [Cytobacillus sp. S13-E01]MDF0727199.1 cytochrome c [Cytobacillus sp. S13-E01]